VQDQDKCLKPNCHAAVGDRAASAQELAGQVKSAGVTSLLTSGALAAITAGLNDAKNANAREGALLALAQLAEQVGKPAEPYLMPLLANALALLADKQVPVREAAAKAQVALENLLTPYGVSSVLPILFEGMVAQKWQTNEGACKLLASMADHAPSQTAVCLPEIVPKATEAMGNAREVVKKAAADAMTKCMQVVGNRDLNQFIPILIDCMQNPVKVPDTVHKLAATTFVQVSNDK
jgi:elongation factor 3